MINCIKSWLCMLTTKWVHCTMKPWAARICTMVWKFMTKHLFTINKFIYIHIHSKLQNSSAAKSSLHPRQGSMVFFHYQFKPEPWLTKTSFLVLLDYICVLRVAILYKLWHEKQVKETQVFILMTWEELMSFHDNSDLIIIFETLTYISNLRLHKFINEGTM